MSIDFRPQSQSYVAGILAGALGSLLFFSMAWRILDHLPLYDELLHIFAARGIRDHGTPTIADGLYERAEWFTWIVAVAIKTLGDTLSAARVPSLLAAGGLIMRHGHLGYPPCRSSSRRRGGRRSLSAPYDPRSLGVRAVLHRARTAGHGAVDRAVRIDCAASHAGPANCARRFGGRVAAARVAASR